MSRPNPRTLPSFWPRTLRRTSHALCALAPIFASLLLCTTSGCGDSAGGEGVPTTPGSTNLTGGTGTGPQGPCKRGDPGTQLCEPVVQVLPAAQCPERPTDFVPGSTTDAFPACAADSGVYPLLGARPSTIDRVNAYQAIAQALWRDGRPCPEDFIRAQQIFEQAQGLASRVQRREDVHYPEIPADQHIPGIEADKQCGDPTLAQRFPDRCAGPMKIAPLIQAALVEGSTGAIGDLNIPAAKIKAALSWFLYLSIYKEAQSCFGIKAEDCDSSWAYYTGGELDPNAPNLLGLAEIIKTLSVPAHQAIINGLLAVRCVRELYPPQSFPTMDETFPEEGRTLFLQAHEQLDNALHRGFAILVRQHLQVAPTCTQNFAANWTFLQVVGPVLDREAIERNPALGQELAALWKTPHANAASMTRAKELLDQIFPCSSR